jgi:hypothetical protein
METKPGRETHVMWHSHNGLQIIPSHPHCFRHENPLSPFILSYLCYQITYLCILLLCFLLTLLHTFPEYFLPLAYTAFTTNCQLLHHLHLLVSLHSPLLYHPNFLLPLQFSDLYLNVHLATTTCLVSLFSKPCPSQFSFSCCAVPTAGADNCFYRKKVSHGCVMSQSVV